MSKLWYEQQLSIPQDYCLRKIDEFLNEDIPDTDKTTDAIFSGNEMTIACIQAEEEIILAGGNILKYFFDSLSSSVHLYFGDGVCVRDNEIIAEIKAPADEILKKERVMLNLLQRMSGIASNTRKYSVLAEPFGVKILDTRKTTPGLRLFEKYSVCMGGGYNHRMDLSSGILIKDNHIRAAGRLTNAVRNVRKKNYGLQIEVEAENTEQIKEALEAGVDGILLDNMQPEKIFESVSFIRKFAGGENIFIEASGGINLENISGYLNTGIDAISIGALTHSLKSSNIHLEFR